MRLPTVILLCVIVWNFRRIIRRAMTVRSDPLTMPHFCLRWWSANLKTPSMMEPHFRSQTSWQILNWNPVFLFEFPSNHGSVSFSFSVIRVWPTDKQTDHVDHYYSWPPNCGRPANNVKHCCKPCLYKVCVKHNWKFLPLTFRSLWEDYLALLPVLAMVMWRGKTLPKKVSDRDWNVEVYNLL